MEAGTRKSTFRVILTKYSHQFQLCLLNIVCFGLPTECHLARSHLLDFSCAVQKNLVFLGEKCGRKVWISYLSLHIGGMILCPTEKSVPVQGFCCYQWCEAISWSEVLGRPAQKSGPGEQEETLGREEQKQWNEFLSTCRIQLVFCFVQPQKMQDRWPGHLCLSSRQQRKCNSAWENREHWSSFSKCWCAPGCDLQPSHYLYILFLGGFAKSQGFR